jgi:uncharacterized membrane protein YphA (DoxX/SURF4 family)
VLLWTVQVLLALLFVSAGASKEAMSAAQLTQFSSLPVPFIRFIGVCELLGALGLILPGLFRIRPGLTPLAAAGLVIIMVGATVVTLATSTVAAALLPLVVGVLAVSVVYGRSRVAPLRGERRVWLPSRSARPALQ